MERFQTVNDSSKNERVTGGFEPHPAAGSAPLLNVAPISDSAAAGPGGLGPCLYLGPNGQRCSEPALVGGFCSKHQPGAAKVARRVLPRVVGAGIGILAAMWPVLADLLREVIRWIHSH
jgi:hypothetical protein